MNSRRFILATLWCGTAAATAYAQDSVRNAEIAHCLPGEIMSWGDGRDRPALSSPMVFVYEHAAAPSWFDAGLVLAMVQKAASTWSTCGVPSQVVNRTANLVVTAQAVSVRWSESQSAGNFGLADFSNRTLVLNPAAFQLLKTRNPTHDARETLQMVVSHEMGHLFGLMSHSRRCVDVMSSYDNGKGEVCYARDMALLRRYTEYRATLPTACDIQRCKVANPVRVPE